MVSLRCATAQDKAQFLAMDTHFPEAEFDRKVRDGRCWFAEDDGVSLGVLRCNLFWDEIPFLTMLWLREPFRRKGYGRQVMALWEDAMRRDGYTMVMVSTQTDESAQHFYRKLGYCDRGTLFLDGTPYEQPPELLMVKVL